MEEYKKLIWSRHNPRSEGKLLEQASIDFADYHNDIFNLHINEIDPMHQIEDISAADTALFLPLEMPSDPRTGQKIQQLEVKCVQPLQLFNRFPSGSVLTRQEHQHCLTVQNRINLRLPFTTADEKKKYARYQVLMEKLAPEKEMFDSFVRNHFNTHLLRRVQTIDPELNELVVRIWQAKVQERIGLQRELGGLYVLMTVVPFFGRAENATNVSFEPYGQEQEQARETGTVRNLFSENVLRCISLKRNERVLEAFAHEWTTVRCTRDQYLADVNACLSELPDVSLVVPAGALTLLLNYAQNAQEQWTIPFQVKKMADGRHVLIMDSRLPPTRLSTHARKVKAYKLLVKSFTTFLASQKSNTELDKSDATEEKDTAEVRFRPLPFDEFMKQMAQKKTANETTRENRFYQPWKLKDQEEEHQLLVCYRQDCYESFRKMRVFMNFSIKLEYQPEFGAEQMTLPELLQEWARQLLRPHSKTMRLRINSTTSTIISHHYLELRDIEEELNRLYGVKPHNLLTNVWKMLKLMRNFPAGQYLLKRDGKSTQGPSVYARPSERSGGLAGQNAPSGVSLNWEELLCKVEYDCPPLEQYDWIPIDKFVITQLHRTNTLFPCSFPHWTNLRWLNTRQSQMKAKPVEKKAPGGKKKKGVQKELAGAGAAAATTVATQMPPATKVLTPVQLARREKVRLRRQLAREKKLKAETIQQSLHQFAPYAGPVQGKNPEGNTAEGRDGAATEGKDQPISVVQQASAIVDYKSYVEQAALNPDEQL
uniref:Little elongation complex subunit 2 C-terminal domain-containing protein n=1 Tax=Anopheles melas TaxID=34690 RepID=A0A182TN57_9DIPT